MDSVQPAEASKTAFELVTLGVPSLRDRLGQIPVGLGSGKPLALLCFLVVRGEVRRDEALSLLWGDVEEERARNAFRQALHRLRLALGEDLVVGDRQTLRISLAHGLRADVTEFDRAIDEGRLDEAVAYYGGDFLAGFDVGSRAFDDWVAAERMRLRARCVAAAERAAQQALVAGRMREAESAIRKLLAVAPMDPRVIEVAASGLVALGRRDQAVSVLVDFARGISAEGEPMPRALQSMLDRLSPATGEPSVGHTRGDTVFLGRATELARLLAAWSAVGEDSGATVVIEGPSGIGKTRLLQEMMDTVRALGVAHVLSAVEGPRGLAAPYASVATALRPLVRAPGVAGASPHLLAEAARLLPELRDTFQLPAVESTSEETARLRVCEGIAALVEAAAYERPILLAVEDVQRASSSTLELVGYLSSRLKRARVALVLTFNAEDLSRDVAVRLRALAGSSHHVLVPPLSSADTTALVEQLLGSSSREMAAQLAARAQGNPLRAMELARLTLDGVAPTSLPTRLVDLARDRIVSCSSNERRLLLTTALLARPAGLRLLADSSHLGASASDDAARGLKQRGLLVEVGSAYVTSSESVAEASIEVAGEATTAFVAGWIAETLARDGDNDAGEVARLFAVAGRIGDTCEWSRRAAERAIARGATEEALYFLKVSRQFSRSGSEIASVESLLLALGAGRTRLPASEARPARRRDRLASFVERLFPNWRYLIGGAVATSLVAIILTAWGPAPVRSTVTTQDTLVVAQPEDLRRGLVRLVSGIGAHRSVSAAVAQPPRQPAWVDSIGLPWVNALPSPTGRFVGLERITPTGSKVYLVSAERHDTISLEAGEVEAFGMGWSPDGETFLVTRRRTIAGDFQLGLFAVPLSRARLPVPIDTIADHSVSEAAWSPDGSHIAWVARVRGGQEEVFVSWADGSNRRNLSAHPAQDYHIAWSPDGSLIAFTSRRDGNAELYAYDLPGERLWRLTDNGAQDDRAAFDADGRFVAFESTRGGALEVYIMPSLGGIASQVGDSASGYEIVGWRRSGRRYLDRLQLGVPQATNRGDTIVLRVRGMDQLGAPMALLQTQWTVLDPGLLLALAATPDASPLEQRLVALRDGLARVVVSIGSWRTDTAYIKVGRGPVTLLHDDFGEPRLTPAWRPLGQPSPVIGSVAGDRFALVLNADRQWESGVLSTASIPIQPGLTVETTLHAPFEMHAPATSATLALVAPDPPEAIDTAAPRFLRLISIKWDADARRLIYAAERDVFVEAVPTGALEGVRTLALKVNADGTVAFLVDGVQRWSSTLRLLRLDRAAVAQIWLGGQDTGKRVAFGNLNATLASPR